MIASGDKLHKTIHAHYDVRDGCEQLVPNSQLPSLSVARLSSDRLQLLSQSANQQHATEVVIDVTNATEHGLTVSIFGAKLDVITSASPLESLSFLRNRCKQSVCDLVRTAFRCGDIAGSRAFGDSK